MLINVSGPGIALINWPSKPILSRRAGPNVSFTACPRKRGAALSVPTNIAEGAARLGRKEFARYLNIALGSLAELHYLLEFARDLGICEPSDRERLDRMRDQTGRLLWCLYRRMRTPT
jgi:four helix bundle protein